MSEWPTESELEQDAAAYGRARCLDCGDYDRLDEDHLCGWCSGYYKSPEYLAECQKRREEAAAKLKAQVEASPTVQAVRAKTEQAVKAMKSDKEDWARRVQAHLDRDPI